MTVRPGLAERQAAMRERLAREKQERRRERKNRARRRKRSRRKCREKKRDILRSLVCASSDCEKTFITVSKDRKYCSTKCMRRENQRRFRLDTDHRLDERA